MVFSSVYFIFHFLPMVLAAYALTPRRARLVTLVVCSYLFYGWANPLFAFLLLFSTLVDFLCARWMVASGGATGRVTGDQLTPGETRNGTQKAALIISLLTNLGILAFFKYYHFAFDNFQALGFGGSNQATASAWSIVLPLGLSFYTLQSMSYTIDVYRGHAAITRNPIHFAAYVSLFPQLVAGPIVRWQQLAGQLLQCRQTSSIFARGAIFFSIGLAKKVLLANPCSRIADTAFDAHHLHSLDAWLGVLAYSMQIYFDFSAYSDMAIGLGLMLGLQLPVNFNSPYKAISFSDFWRRWHISLSTWLRDYLYIPLGGNRHRLLRTLINLMLVMLIGGFWHGAAWTFVAWGACHGLFLVAERLLRRTNWQPLPAWVARALVFTLVSLTWVLFRSESISDAGRYFAAMFAGSGAEAESHADLVSALIDQPYLLMTLGAALLFAWFGKPTEQLGGQLGDKLKPAVATYALILFALSVFVLSLQTHNPFIYFHF